MKALRFEVEGCVFLYDPNTNLLLKCHPAFADAAERLGESDWGASDPRQVESEIAGRIGNGSRVHARAATRLWYFLGAFQSEGPSILNFPGKAELSDAQGEISSLNSLTLCVTDDCNLRCSYCSYSGNYECAKTLSHRRMSRATALAAVDYFAEHSGGRERVYYSFYGGEPLLAWDIARDCLARIRDREGQKNREHFVTMTTNGTLLTGEIARELVKSNVFLTVSLDGPAEIHDLHRRSLGGKGSFEKIMGNLDRLQEHHAGYYRRNVSFSVVLSEPERIQQTNEFFARGPAGGHTADHFQVSFVAARNAKREFAAGLEDKLREADLARVADEFVQASSSHELNKCKLTNAYYTGKMNNKILRRRLSLRREPFRPGNQCEVGVHNLFVSVDGSIYPCSALEQPPYRLGDVSAGLSLERVETVLKEYQDRLFGRCGSCWAARQCRLCLANMMGEQGRSETALDAQCLAQKESLIEMMKMHCKVLLHRGETFACRECDGQWTFPDVIEAEMVEEGLAHLGVFFQDDE